MNKLQALTAYLAGHFTTLGIRAENLETFQEGGELQPGGGNETTQGHHLADWKYRAALTFERLPAASAGLVLALVQVWLNENDADRGDQGLAPPQGNIDPLEENARFVDLELTLELIDPLYLVEDPAGPINWMGKPFGFGTYLLDVAEQGHVGHGADL